VPVDDAIMQIALQFRLPALPIVTQSAVEDEDWVVKVQASFTPVQIGDAWVVFPWHTKPDPHALCVIMEHGMAFGTGEHATTQLCVKWLNTAVKGGEHVLDYGSGSSILSIFAVKFGASSATGALLKLWRTLFWIPGLKLTSLGLAGIEIEEDSITTARKNIINNDVESQVSVFLPGQEPVFEQGYDIVVANILLQPLQILAPTLARKARPGARVALSGIITTQVDELKATYQQHGFILDDAQVQGEWALVHGVRTA